MSAESPRSRRTLIAVILILLIVPPFIKYAWWETWEYVGGDYEIFSQAARNLAEGHTPYPLDVVGQEQVEAGKAWGNYIYPPVFARLLYPFTLLPDVWGKKLYLAVCMALYFWMLWPTGARGYATPLQRWTALAILFGWGPVIHTFRHGQSDFIPLFLILAAVWLLKRENGSSSDWRWQFLAGIFMGMASMVKITPVLLFPVFFVAGRWRICQGFAAGAIGILALTGPVTSFQYFTEVLPNMRDFAGMRQCPSLHIVLVRLLDPTMEAWFGEHAGRIIAETLGVGISGGCYLGFLLHFWQQRIILSNRELLILACWLPPLFAGEVAHHYTLAIIPALEAMRLLLDGLQAEELLNAGGNPKRILLIAAFTFCLLPDFYYWDVVKMPIENWLPGDLSFHLTAGTLAACWICLLGIKKAPAAEPPTQKVDLGCRLR